MNTVRKLQCSFKRVFVSPVFQTDPCHSHSIHCDHQHSISIAAAWAVAQGGVHALCVHSCTCWLNCQRLSDWWLCHWFETNVVSLDQNCWWLCLQAHKFCGKRKRLIIYFPRLQSCKDLHVGLTLCNMDEIPSLLNSMGKKFKENV